MEGNALIMNLQATAKTAISPLLVVLGFSVLGALTGHITSYMIASLAGSLILLKYYKSLGKPSSGSFSSILKVMLSYGFPLYASALLGLFIGQYQTILLAFFASNAEIGNFNVAMTLTSLINVLIFPLGTLFPAFSKVNPNTSELRRLFKLSTKYTALLIIPATLIVAILSKDIVSTLYGYSYGSAPFFLQLYILSFLYSGLGSIVLSYLFNGIGETKVVFKYSLINLLIFLPLAPALTIAYHVPGLIVASLTSSLLPLAYGLFIATKKIHVNLDLKASLRIYLASFISAIPVLALLYIMPLNSLLNLAINVPIFLLAYLILLPITGAIQQSDIDNFKLMFNKLKMVWPLLKPVLAFEAKLLNL
jgi:O-antigen/teichoic acid export membrane protein